MKTCGWRRGGLRGGLRGWLRGGLRGGLLGGLRGRRGFLAGLGVLGGGLDTGVGLGTFVRRRLVVTGLEVLIWSNDSSELILFTLRHQPADWSL